MGIILFELIYNKRAFPLKKYEGGIVGLTKAVMENDHQFDDKVPVTKICKDFINKCLMKD